MRDLIRDFAWVLRDGWRRYPRDMTRVIGAEIAGILASGVAIAGILLCVRREGLEEVAPIPVVVVALGLVGVVGAVFLLVSESILHRIGREYEALSLERFLRAMRSRERLSYPTPTPRREELSRMANFGTRWIAFSLVDLQRLVVPTLTLILASVWLLITEARLTGILTLLGVLYLVPLAWLYRSLVRCHERYTTANQTVRRDLGGIWGRIARDEEIADEEWGALDGMHAHDGDYRRSLDQLYGRLLADQKIRFLNQAFFLTCALVIVFGIGSGGSESPWTDGLTYLVVLRFAFGALRRISALAGRLSRYRSEFRPYLAMLDAAGGDERSDEEKSAMTGPPRNGSSIPQSCPEEV